MSETTTEESVELQPYTCDACGQTDTDPMIHVAYGSWKKDARTIITEPSFHFDCLPEEFRAQLVGPQNAVTAAAVEGADNGTHGEDLREFIQSQPTDNNVEPAEGAGDETPEA